ncbi:MAG: hypothetical protein QOJ94_3283 [Sphingomonadales bacterium]|nr:hypothetical protein [Sphingomonadales bacterium]
MHYRDFGFLLGACAVFALAGCDRTGSASKAEGNGSETANASAAAHPTDPIESAMAAAPASVAKDATIVEAQADGSMKTLRQGRNGWTCMPDSPTTPGPDPMCMDKNAAAWATAWMGKKPPTDGVPGIMYMLAGGTDASNTDPYAKAPTGGGDWIKTGPHVMIVGSKAVLAGYPSGPGPDTKAPYVMWAGTPYAHLMIPVEK